MFKLSYNVSNDGVLLVTVHNLGPTATVFWKWDVSVFIYLDPLQMAAGYSVLPIILGLSVTMHIGNLMLLSNIQVPSHMECLERGRLNVWLLKKI
jgi:hypothetical protein